VSSQEVSRARKFIHSVYAADAEVKPPGHGPSLGRIAPGAAEVRGESFNGIETVGADEFLHGRPGAEIPEVLGVCPVRGQLKRGRIKFAEWKRHGAKARFEDRPLHRPAGSYEIAFKAVDDDIDGIVHAMMAVADDGEESARLQ